MLSTTDFSMQKKFIVCLVSKLSQNEEIRKKKFSRLDVASFSIQWNTEPNMSQLEKQILKHQK